MDHIIPESLGGRTTLDNLCLACWSCNLIEQDRIVAADPETGATVRIFNPNTQEWGAHFAWQMDGLLVVGLTPTGRATVNALRLNRPELVNARRLWIEAGGIHLRDEVTVSPARWGSGILSALTAGGPPRSALPCGQATVPPSTWTHPQNCSLPHTPVQEHVGMLGGGRRAIDFQRDCFVARHTRLRTQPMGRPVARTDDERLHTEGADRAVLVLNQGVIQADSESLETGGGVR